MSLLVPDFIDRDVPLTRRQRKAVRKEAWKLWFKDWRNVLVYLLLLAVLFGGTLGLGWLSGPLGLALFGVKRTLFIMVVYTALSYCVFALLHRFRFAPLVRRIVSQQGYESCIKCGYWLRGLANDAKQCPECGHALPVVRG